MLRRAELVCGLAGGVLALIAVALGWLLPVSSTESRVIANGIPQPVIVHETSLTQFLGTPTAVSILTTFVLFALWIALTAYFHTRGSQAGSLGMLWAGAVLFAFASLLGWFVFGYMFVPGAALGLVAAVLGTLRQLSVPAVVRR